MATIPETVKIKGRVRHVSVSARGCVSIGHLVVWGNEPMEHWECPSPWETFKSTASQDEWQGMLHACFVECLRRYRRYARTLK